MEPEAKAPDPRLEGLLSGKATSEDPTVAYLVRRFQEAKLLLDRTVQTLREHQAKAQQLEGQAQELQGQARGYYQDVVAWLANTEEEKAHD